MSGPTNIYAARPFPEMGTVPTFPVGTFGQGASIGVEIVAVGIRIITDNVAMISGIGEDRP